MLPRRFALVRHIDYTGISGVGVVAYGVVFADGHVVLRWSSDHPATSLWDSIDDVLAIHGHGEATSIEWIDPATDLGGPQSSLYPPGRRARRTTREVEPDTVRAAEPAEPAAPATSSTTEAPEPPAQPPPPPPTPVYELARESAAAGSASQPAPSRFSLLIQPAPVDPHNVGVRVPPQRRPGRHRRAAPEPTRSESDGR